MQTETTEQEFHEKLGVSKERFDSINENLAHAVKEYFDNDKYQSKSDAIKLAIEQCKPESGTEGVLVGMALEACMMEYGDPLALLLRMIAK